MLVGRSTLGDVGDQPTAERAEGSVAGACSKWGSLIAGSTLVPAAAFAALRVPYPPDRSLKFYNLHTGESLNTVYCENGRYIPGALSQVNYILRDFRANEIKAIDPRLLDLLYSLNRRLYTQEPFEIISGYRSPATNAMLAARSEGRGPPQSAYRRQGRRYPGAGTGLAGSMARGDGHVERGCRLLSAVRFRPRRCRPRPFLVSAEKTGVSAKYQGGDASHLAFLAPDIGVRITEMPAMGRPRETIDA